MPAHRDLSPVIVSVGAVGEVLCRLAGYRLGLLEMARAQQRFRTAHEARGLVGEGTAELCPPRAGALPVA